MHQNVLLDFGVGHAAVTVGGTKALRSRSKRLGMAAVPSQNDWVWLLYSAKTTGYGGYTQPKRLGMAAVPLLIVCPDDSMQVAHFRSRRIFETVCRFVEQFNAEKCCVIAPSLDDLQCMHMHTCTHAHTHA